MMKTVSFQLEDELADRFELALQLTGDDRNAVAAALLRQYLGKALAQTAKEYSEPESAQTEKKHTPPPPHPPYGTPNHRKERQPDYWEEWRKETPHHPHWERDAQQYYHKILRAFFDLQQELGKVTEDALRRRCSDPNRFPNTYVPCFDQLFSQMKFDHENFYGKIFEVREGIITIWDQIEDALQKWRDSFH